MHKMQDTLRTRKGAFLMKNAKTRITVCLLLIFVLIAAMFCSCTKDSSQDSEVVPDESSYETVQVHVAYWGGLSESPLFVAYEQGMFEKYGIDVDFVQMQGSCAEWLAQYEPADEVAENGDAENGDGADNAGGDGGAGETDNAASDNAVEADSSGDANTADTTDTSDNTGEETSSENETQKTPRASECCIFLATPNFLSEKGKSMNFEFLSEVQRGGIQVCVPSRSKINSLSDLSKKTIATASSHDVAEVFTKAALINSNVDYDNCEFKSEKSFSKLLKEMQDGTFDAFALSDPYGQIVCEYFGYKSIFNSATDENFKDVSYTYLAGNSAVYLDEDVSARVKAAVDEACQWIEDNPSGTSELIQGINNSGTCYVAKEETLLEAFGVSVEENSSSLYESILETYSWGNVSDSHFESSLSALSEIIKAAGMTYSED